MTPSSRPPKATGTLYGQQGGRDLPRGLFARRPVFGFRLSLLNQGWTLCGQVIIPCLKEQRCLSSRLVVVSRAVCSRRIQLFDFSLSLSDKGWTFGQRPPSVGTQVRSSPNVAVVVFPCGSFVSASSFIVFSSVVREFKAYGLKGITHLRWFSSYTF